MPGEIEATTPATVSLDRSFDYVVSLTKEGYEPARARINRQYSSATLSSAFIPYVGIVALATDSMTDAEFDLHPDPLSVVMRPEGDKAEPTGIPAAAEPVTVVVFNSGRWGAEMWFSLGNNQNCELGEGEYAKVTLMPGSYPLGLYHWDLFKFDDSYDIQIDATTTHLGVFPSTFGNHYSYFEGFPVNREQYVETRCENSASMPKE